MKINSYPKIWNLGHPNVADLLKEPVLVEEKVDGSQISWGIIGGELCARSKGAELFFGTTDALFRPALDSIKRMAEQQLLVDDWVYRGEAFKGPKHNTLRYSRAPENHIVLFDVYHGPDTADEKYESKRQIARELGIDCAPMLFHGTVTDVEQIREFLERESFLGGPKIEGVVVKNYQRFGPDGKYLFGKYVSEAFRETHKTAWKESNPTRGDVILELGARLSTPARWEKAVQHLRDKGTLTNSPQDIGPLMAEVQRDIEEEETEWIKQQLWKWGWPRIKRLTTSGLPEWYKQRLLESQFGTS